MPIPELRHSPAMAEVPATAPASRCSSGFPSAPHFFIGIFLAAPASLDAKPTPARMHFGRQRNMSPEKLELLRENTRRLCAERKLKILRYGPAWWILGHGVSRVFADLAGIGPSDLKPLPVYER